MKAVMKQINPEVAEFLSKPIDLFIDGDWTPADDGKVVTVMDPGEGSALAEIAVGRESDINRAVEAARKAFDESGWATMPPNDRAVILHRLADLIDKYRDVLAQIESLNVGMPIYMPETFDVPDSAQAIRYYADLSVHTRRSEPIAVPGHEARTVRLPYGVCAFIFPWNAPFALLNWGTSPALAAGNAVVVKPATAAPLSTLFFCKLATKAGVPSGIINVVPGNGGTAGEALANHTGIDRMSFTGSPDVGRKIAEACGRNLVPTKLELGGKGAAVVFNDVDVNKTADLLAGVIVRNAGQVCCTASRWLLHESIMRPFLNRVVKDLESTKVGYGLDSGSEMGPVISDKQRQTVLGYLERGENEGATPLVKGGSVVVRNHEGGFFVKPALLTGSPDNVCAKEEIFGPVAYVMPFKEEDEAVRLVNRSSYGLANSVWTGDMDRANRVAEAMVAGNSWINAHNVFVHGVPYGGAKMSGLGGGVLGASTLLDYLRPQSVVRPLN